MRGKLPQAFIDDILLRVDIVNFIHERLNLRKKGANYTACCPFHQEKSPSFTVNQAKQMFYCFGCGVGGNVIQFLMLYERLSFPEAMAVLAQEAGMPLPEEGNSEQASHLLKCYELMRQVAQYYQTALKGATEAVTYLKNRGLSGEIAKRYQLGFAPDAWEGLKKALPGLSSEIGLSLGLQIQHSSGRCYDRFRGRIMFPIRDVQGRVVGFGGRIVTQGEPKYLNSPETLLFHKGRELYGLYEARKFLRDLERLIVVEGYMDVIMLAQHGILNAVATLGTATTEAHFKKIFKYTSNIVFCFDGDRAGKEAAWRALQVALPLLEDGVQIRFAFLPSGEDPDSLVRKVGQAAFLDLIGAALTLTDYLFSELSKDYDVSKPEGQAALSQAVSALINKMPESILKQMTYQRLQQLVPLSMTKLKKLTGAQPSQSISDLSRRMPAAKKKQEAASVSTAERALALLLQFPDQFKGCLQEVDLMIWPASDRDLFLLLLKVIEERKISSSAQWLEIFRDRPEHQRVAFLLMLPSMTEEENVRADFESLFLRLKQDHLQSQIETLLFKGKTQGLSEDEKIQLRDWINAAKLV